MIEIYFALGIVTVIGLVERALKQQQSLGHYFLWFFVVLTSMYMAKIYCAEPIYKKKHDFVIPSLTLEDKDYDEDEGFIHECKFVPPGTPPEFINDDNSLSKAVLKIIISTDKNTAKQSLKLHKEKGLHYYKEAKNICWYFPNLSQRDKLKMAFTTTIAAIPGPIHVKTIMAISTLLLQYGLHVIDGFYDIEFNLNMSEYHYRMAEAFKDHIKKNDW